MEYLWEPPNRNSSSGEGMTQNPRCDREREDKSVVLWGVKERKGAGEVAHLCASDHSNGGGTREKTQPRWIKEALEQGNIAAV